MKLIINDFEKRMMFSMFSKDGFDYPSKDQDFIEVQTYFKNRMEELKSDLEVKFIDHGPHIWKHFNFGISARKEILKKSMISFSKSVIQNNEIKHLCPISNDGTNGFVYQNYIRMDQINEHTSSSSSNPFTAPDGSSFKIYMLAVPFIYPFKNGGQFPYNIPDETGDFTSITDMELNVISQKLNRFYLLDEVRKQAVFDLWYDSHVILKLGFPLMNITGVAVIVFSDGRKYFTSEGLMDLYLDFSSSFKKNGEINFNNFLPSGVIPTLVQKIRYCGREGNIRIPTYDWLLYDQIRMLYEHLRANRPDYNEGYGNVGVNKWIERKGSNPTKYLKKIKGMLVNYVQILEKINITYKTPGGIEAMRTELQMCTDESECVPSKFLMYLNNVNNVFNVDSLITHTDCSKLAISGKRQRVKSKNKKKNPRKKGHKKTQKVKGKK